VTSPIASVIFLIGSHIFSQAGLDLYPFMDKSLVAGMTGMYHYTQFIGWGGGGLTDFFASAGFKPQSSQSPPPEKPGTTVPGLPSSS
jgi:hypothetical protein